MASQLTIDRRTLMMGASTSCLVWMAVGSAADGKSVSLPSPGGKWPQHNLLMPDLSASWDAALLQKPILERLKLKTFVDPSQWKARFPARLPAHSEPSELRIECPMMDRILLASPGANGRPSSSTSYIREDNGAAYWRHHMPAPSDWSGYNRIAFKIKPDRTGLASYRLVLALISEDAKRNASDPLAFHFMRDLRPGEWNEVLWEFAELPRARVTQFAILMPLVGPLGKKAGYTIRDFELQRVVPEKIEGWTPREGQIACNHLGYSPWQRKTAIASAEGYEFRVEDNAGKIVATLPARMSSGPIGEFAILDFSEVRKAGRYTLRYGSQRSFPVEIGDARALSLVEPLTNFFYADRCGHAVAGHGRCHAELFAEHGGKKYPINGGWHDAGNLCQGSYRTALATLSLFDAFRRLGADLPQASAARLLEEACWGLDWLMKSRFGKGVRVVDGPYTYMQDGVPGNGDEIVVKAGNTCFESFLFVSAAATAAATLTRSDAGRARQALAAALEDYHAALDALPANLGSLPEGSNLPAPHELLAHAVLAALALDAVSPHDRFRADAASFARRLMSYQEQRLSNNAGITGYYNRDPCGARRVTYVHTSFADAPAQAFAALCRAMPLHEDRVHWHAAVALESECFLLRGAQHSRPYHHVPTQLWKAADSEHHVRRAAAMIQFADMFGAPDIAPSASVEEIRADLAAELDGAWQVSHDEWLRIFPIAEDRVFHGSGTIQLARAISLTTAARMRRSAAMSDLAQDQLDWHLGKNPFCASLIYGVGHRYASHMQLWSDDFVGALPVGMDSRRDRPFWPHTCHMTFREMWVVPAARMLALSAELAERCTVEGNSAISAACVSNSTGERWPIKKGRFALSLFPGQYSIHAGLRTVDVWELLPGGYLRRDVSERPLQRSTLKLIRRDQQLSVAATVSAASKPRLLGHNLHIGEPARMDDMLVWPVRSEDDGRAWVALLISETGDVLADLVQPLD